MGSSEHIKIFTILFEAEIFPSEVHLFRGAVLEKMKSGDRPVDILFHNHSEGEGFRFAYPLIQYKCIAGRAAIVCIGQGIEVVNDLLSSVNGVIDLGGREVYLGYGTVIPSEADIFIMEESTAYVIRRWTPLNSKNYSEYCSMESLAEKVSFLENTLIGNILSAAKGLGIHFDQQVECKILKISEPYIIRNKGVKIMAFDAEFKSNVSLPDGIGLGKHASIGHGTISVKQKP